MVPMVHLLESQGRDRLLDGDANGTRVLQVGLWIVKQKLSECVCALVAQQTEQRAVRTTGYGL